MIASSLPELPAAFAESARHLETGVPGPAFIPLEIILQEKALADGLAGLLRRWGPGDYRAAVSLWTQGYFGRFLRPVLAYGLIHDIWFSAKLADISVALSDISIPVRFALKQARPASLQQHLSSIIHEHAQQVIARIVDLTGTSERLHWSNASFAFHRYHEIQRLWPEAEVPPAIAGRLLELERMIASDHPLFYLTRKVSDAESEHRLMRKVCCIRFKLDGLKQCAAACPIARQACRSRGRNVDRREPMPPLRLPDSAQKRVDVRGPARLTNPSDHRH